MARFTQYITIFSYKRIRHLNEPVFNESINKSCNMDNYSDWIKRNKMREISNNQNH